MPDVGEKTEVLRPSDRVSLKIAPETELNGPTPEALRRLSKDPVYTEYADAFRAEVRRVLAALPSREVLAAAKIPDANGVVGRIVVTPPKKGNKPKELTPEQEAILDTTSEYLGIDLNSRTAKNVSKMYRNLMSTQMITEMEGVIDQTRKSLEAYLATDVEEPQESTTVVEEHHVATIPKVAPDTTPRISFDVGSVLKGAAPHEDRIVVSYRDLTEDGESEANEDEEDSVKRPRRVPVKKSKSADRDLKTENGNLRRDLNIARQNVEDVHRENRRLLALLNGRGEALFDENGMLHLPGLHPSFCVDVPGIFRVACSQEQDPRIGPQVDLHKKNIAHLFRALLIAIPDPDAGEERIIDIAAWDDGCSSRVILERFLGNNGVKSMVYPDIIFPAYWNRGTNEKGVYFTVSFDVEQYREELLFIRGLFQFIIRLCEETKYQGRDHEPDVRPPEIKRLDDEKAVLEVELANLRAAIDQGRTILTGLKKEAQRTIDGTRLAKALRKITDPSVRKIADALGLNVKVGPREAVLEALKVEIEKEKSA